MKKEYQDDFDNFIKEGLGKQAEIEMQSVKDDESLADLPDDLKESMHQKIKERIREAEEKKEQEKYAGLSEEDRKALELGRKMLEEGNVTEFKASAKKGLSYRSKLRLKHALGAAAVLAVVMLVEVNSLGGPEKVVQLVKQQVAEREVEKINSSSDSKVIVKENEEEAYQTIADEFGVEPVRIRERPEGMKFTNLELDKGLQMAEMTYEYKGNSIRYVINTKHQDTSFGLDVEDTSIENYIIKKNQCSISIKGYEVSEISRIRYVAKYSYEGVDYSLIGVMGKQEIEKIIKNLFFY